MSRYKTAYNMSFVSGKYYLYRHIRLDSGLPFYVGIGTRQRGHNEKSIYLRAYTKANRSEFWGNITKKTEYDVEIIYHSHSIEEIKRKETEFILLYGRKESGGLLCNMTDGGDGLNTSSVSTKKRIDTMVENGEYDKMVYRLREYNRSRISSGVISRKKRVFVYSLNGVFVKSFETVRECANELGVSESAISTSCFYSRATKKYIFSFSYLGEMADVSGIILIHDRPANCAKKTVVQNLDTGEESVHLSMRDAAKHIGMKGVGHINRAIRKGFYKNYTLRHD